MADPRGPGGRILRGPLRLVAAAMGVVAVALVGVLVVGVLLPGDWEAEREIRIEAAAETVFPFLASAEGWAEWTPMPETGIEPLEPEGGRAPGWSWDDPGYGEGVFMIEEAEPPRRLRYRVEVEGGSLRTDGLLVLEAVEGATRVRWREEGDFGRNPLLGYMATRMGEVQGEQMARSLERLRRLAEEPRGEEGSVEPRPPGPLR